ncbi:hypothetical protein V6N11_029812 [Hibiscus sabdariffa]|uniref:Uncharacterized protein n=2 Tax=Hibiscus sabdariffa TaxID=183260 RepID=A0ABR2PJ06_9ROSI
MNVSHASVHPVEDLPTADGGGPNNNEVPRVRMKDIQGMPGTAGGLALRICHYLVAATGLQSLWSLSQAIIDVYALLVRRSFQLQMKLIAICLHVYLYRLLLDLITSTLTFAAACASAGITLVYCITIISSELLVTGIQINRKREKLGFSDK